MSFKELQFSGHFCPQHRQRLRDYRQIYGLTYRDMGRILGCEWTTVMKWEKGECLECNTDKLLMLQSFFNNDACGVFYDAIERRYSEMASRLLEIIRARQGFYGECGKG